MKWNKHFIRRWPVIKYNTNIKRILIDDYKLVVGEGLEVVLPNKETNHHDHYTGVIIEMTDTFIKISNIKVNGCHRDGEMTFKLKG